jgi:hypothetical protein
LQYGGGAQVPPLFSCRHMSCFAINDFLAHLERPCCLSSNNS